MARKSGNGSWQIDWAGRHGTAWGTVNAVLSTTTAAWAVHLAESWWPIPVLYAVLGGIAVTIVGVLFVLLRASLSSKRRPTATVLYQVACYVGAGGWLTYMVAEADWTWRWVLPRIGALMAAAVVAGLLASLASPEPDDQANDATAATAAAAAAAAAADADPQQASRTDIATAWKERLNRLTGQEGWDVPNVEKWERGNGYTVEAIAPAGGATWKLAERYRDQLEGDLDLPTAGGVNVTMGVTKRAALIEVTTKDVLAEDTKYPENRPVHSIRDDLEVGLQDDGRVIGPNLLQNCMLLAGEAGSGKTNAGHCLVAEIVTTNDALLWEWELTGGGLWSAWMDPWLRGEVRTPPIDWCAGDGRELLWMTRAALRIGYSRKPGYRSLMLEVDDDKVPVSPTLPEVILLGDEIAKVTGSLSEHEDAKENLRLIAFELRAAAIREILLALRGTDDVISSSIQSQCQVTGVMKIASKAEANWVFGSHHGFGPEDTPYPGSGGLALGSGLAPVRMKWHRMLPSQIRRVVLLAEARRPKLDELSRLAANGRHPDGTPMPGLLPGELDCYDTRWTRFRQQFGAGTTAASTTAGTARVYDRESPLTDRGVETRTLSPAEATVEMDAALARMDEAVNAERARGGNDVSLTQRERELFDELATQLVEEGFADDWADPNPDRPESMPQPGDEEVLLELLHIAGPAGIGPKDLLQHLAERGIVIHRDTLHERLRALRDANPARAHQPRRGKWAAGPKP